MVEVVTCSDSGHELISPRSAQLEELVAKVRRSALKYPSKASKPPLECFVAIIPAQGPQVSLLTSFERYQRGWFAYWETERALWQGLMPKGWVCLAHIAGVHLERESHDGRGVRVKH